MLRRLDMSYLDREWSAIAAQYPALADPAAPAPAARRSGSESFDAEAHFEQLGNRIAAGTFELRSALPSASGLVGPFRGVGDCLAPVFSEGDMKWIDPSMPAEDCDFVLVRWHPRTLEGIIARGSRRPEWLQMYGDRPPPIATKLLRHVCGERWLVTRSSMLPLGRNRILGVIRHVERTGEGLYAPAAHAIGANGVTAVYAVPITNVASGPGSPAVLNLASVTVGPFSGDMTVVVTYSGSYKWESQAGVTTSYGVSDSSSAITSPIQIYIPPDTSSVRYGPISQELSYTLPGGTAKTYYVNAVPAFVTSPTVGINWYGEMKVEVIKR